MIFIADGGSTKADWIALDNSKNELFRTRTLGLNPAVFTKKTLYDRIINNYQLIQQKDSVKEVYFYGAGCGTSQPTELLKKVLESIFSKATVVVKEDLYAAVYAASADREAIVCILGTGSNSCYFNGGKITTNVVSLGYILMDEASGNYFGKKLIKDFFYKIMPTEIAQSFENKYNLNPDYIKRNLYQEESPNAYLGKFAEFMFNFKEHPYIHSIIEEGFTTFFEYRVKPYNKPKDIPVYFIGSIAYFFENILQNVAQKFGYTINGILRRPIDNLIIYHQKKK